MVKKGFKLLFYIQCLPAVHLTKVAVKTYFHNH